MPADPHTVKLTLPVYPHVQLRPLRPKPVFFTVPPALANTKPTVDGLMLVATPSDTENKLPADPHTA